MLPFTCRTSVFIAKRKVSCYKTSLKVARKNGILTFREYIIRFCLKLKDLYNYTL